MRPSVFKALLGLGATAYAASSVNKQCPSNNVCYSMNIPDAASSSDGPVYFQISGPSSNSWIAMGTGSGMAGSKMFVIYSSSNGKNVTLSTRQGTGHVPPQSSNSFQATLLEGSGVSNGMMTANIKCTSCSTSQSNWIYAAKAGSSLNTDSVSAAISQHVDTYGSFSFNVAQAKGGSDTNPFVSSSGSSSSSGTSGSSNSGSGSSSSGDDCNNGNNGATTSGSGSNSGSSSSSTGPGGFFGFGSPTRAGYFSPTGVAKRQNACNSGSSNANRGSSQYSPAQIKLIAHGVLAGLAFAVFFPFGAIAIRLFNFPGLVYFHAALQVVAQILFIAAFALGITIAQTDGLLNQYHPVIGIVLFILLLLQPILGFMHHSMFKKYQERTIWSHSHIWLGRVIITLGIINGGLGFKLAGNTGYGPLAYGVVAAVMWIVYIVSSVIGERRRKIAAAAPPKYHHDSS